MKKRPKILSKIFMGIMMLFFYAPIIYTIIFSFNSNKSLTHWNGFSLRWYEKMFNNGDMMDAVGYTILVAVLATVISTFVGTITAIGLSKSNKVVKAMVERVNDLPI